MFQYDRRLRVGLLLAGAYGAFALGANNVANVTGAFVGPEMLSPGQAVAIGGASIAAGALMVSKRVMLTVGKGLVRLEIEPTQRARVTGVPVKLRVLRLSMESPEEFFAALAERGVQQDRQHD